MTRVPRGVWILGAVSLLMDVSTEVINSLLPLYLVGALAATPALIGALESLGAVTATFTRLGAGFWSDRTSSRKGLTLLGYGMAALSKPLVPLFASVPGIVAARVLDRVGKGIRTAPRDALVADLTPPALRGAAFGLRKSLDSAGGFIGPLVAILLMILFEDDIRRVFWVASVPALLAVLVLAIGVREPPRSAAAKVTRVTWRDATRLTPAVWRVIGVMCLVALPRFGDAFLLLRAVEIGLAPSLVPMVIVVLNLVYSAMSYPAGWLSDRIGRSPLITTGLGALVAAHVVLAAGESAPMFWTGIGLWGLHLGLTQGVLSTMVADATPEHLRGSAFGVLSVASGLAMAIANAAAGLIWTTWGASWTFATGAVVSIVGVAVVLTARGRS